MNMDEELKKMLVFEREKQIFEKTSLFCFVVAMFLGALAPVFGKTISNVLLISAIVVGAAGLKMLSIWYLLYGGCLSLLEALSGGKR